MRQRQEVQEVLPQLRIFPALPTESAGRKLPYGSARSAATQIHGPHDAFVRPILVLKDAPDQQIAIKGREVRTAWPSRSRPRVRGEHPGHLRRLRHAHALRLIRIPDEGLGLDSCAVAKRVGWCAMS